MDARITELETMVAFHERTIESLSSVLHEQQKALDELGRRLDHTESKLEEVEPSNIKDLADESPPPHY